MFLRKSKIVKLLREHELYWQRKAFQDAPGSRAHAHCLASAEALRSFEADLLRKG